MDQPEVRWIGEPLSLITESVFARYISSLKDQRVAASKVLWPASTASRRQG